MPDRENITYYPTFQPYHHRRRRRRRNMISRENLLFLLLERMRTIFRVIYLDKQVMSRHKYITL